MTDLQIVTEDILSRLFDEIVPLAKLAGHERDSTQDAMRRIVEHEVEPWIYDQTVSG